MRRVHVRDHRRHPHSRVEQGEQRERRQINLARLDPVVGLNPSYLGGEHAVLVDNALGRPGTAAGEQDGGDLVGGRGARIELIVAALGQLPQRRPAPEPPPPDRDYVPDGPERARFQDPHGLCRRDAHQRLWLNAADATQHLPDAHPGIDQHRHRPHLEQGEGQPDELEPWPNHQQRPHAAFDAGLAQPIGVAIA